jgi:hypothetical protein
MVYSLPVYCVRIGHSQPPAVYIVRGLAPSPDSSSSNPFDLSTGYEPGTLKPSATLRASKGPVTTMSNHTDDPQQPKGASYLYTWNAMRDQAMSTCRDWIQWNALTALGKAPDLPQRPTCLGR